MDPFFGFLEVFGDFGGFGGFSRGGVFGVRIWEVFGGFWRFSENSEILDPPQLKNGDEKI